MAVRAAGGGSVKGVDRSFRQLRRRQRQWKQTVREELSQRQLDDIAEQAPVKKGDLRNSHRIAQTGSGDEVAIIIQAGGRRFGIEYHEIVHERDPWMDRAAEIHGDVWRDIIIAAHNKEIGG